MYPKVAAVAIGAFLASSCLAHSWVEQLMVIDSNGSFTGNPGYARNNVLRTSPGFSDPAMVHILPSDGQPALEQRDIGAVDTMGIKPTDPMCKKTQQQPTQSPGSPRLSAASGSMIALRYQENGHVSLPQNQPGKPANRGSIYIYGTTQPKADENFLDVFGQWNADGTGGDKRGRLLAVQPFDDGQCYQVNGGQISQTRQKQFPHESSQLMGADLWCQNDIKLPEDAPSGKPYTIYWIWDWPTVPNSDPNTPNGKAEIYTTCMDVDIQAPSQRRSLHEARNLEPRVMNNAAVPFYMSQMIAPASSASVVSSSATPVVGAPVRAAVAAPSASTSTQQSAPGDSSSAFIAQAASILRQDIVSEIASILTAQGPAATSLVQPVTVTVTQAPSSVQPVTVYVTASTSTGPKISSAPSPSSSPKAITSVGNGNSGSSSVMMPPKSLDIQPPLGLFTGTATPVNNPSPTPSVPSSSPSSSPSNSAAAAAAASSSATGYTAPGTCTKCKTRRRSRIFGKLSTS